MANDLTHNPLRLDTPAVISTTAEFRIAKLRLAVTGVAAASAAEVRDGQDRIIATLDAVSGGSDEITFQPALAITGLELQSISGTGASLYVYCE